MPPDVASVGGAVLPYVVLRARSAARVGAIPVRAVVTALLAAPRTASVIASARKKPVLGGLRGGRAAPGEYLSRRVYGGSVVACKRANLEAELSAEAPRGPDVECRACP